MPPAEHDYHAAHRGRVVVMILMGALFARGLRSDAGLTAAVSAMVVAFVAVLAVELLTRSVSVRNAELAVRRRFRTRRVSLHALTELRADTVQMTYLSSHARTTYNRYHLADESRVIVRPSGTEPKLKVYLEVIEPVGTDRTGGSDAGALRAARGRAAERLAGIRTDLEAATRP